MERKIKFVEGEFYHLFSRGVEKRKIFLDSKDYKRFQALLYILNQQGHFHISNFLKDGRNIKDLYKQDKSNLLVSIISYSLMPNHFHIVVREITQNGISIFMMRLLTAYSMYFNIKNERSGPLFVKPFRSENIDNDPYFLYIFSYVHLNCLDLFENDWKENGIKSKKEAQEFLNNYRYSSYPDLCGLEERLEAKILDFDIAPEISRAPLDISQYGKDFDSV